MGPTEAQVMPSAQLLAGLNQLLAAGGPFDTLTLGLYQNNEVPSRASVIADFDAADFHGYAAVAAIGFTAAFYDVDGTALSMGDATAFIATSGGPLNPQNIYGYVLGSALLAALKAAFLFETPRAIAVVGDAVIVQPFLRYSGI